MSRRIVYEQNVRGRMNAHGMSAAQIVRMNKAGSRATNKASRPPTASRIHVKPDPSVLLSVPVTGTKSAIEYPTPTWFRSNEKVDVSIIVPMYRSQEVLPELIASWPLDGKLSWEAIFVDDKCPSNSKEAVLRSWTARRSELTKPVGKIIVNTGNKGFGLTCNTGVEYATGDHVIFLNADTKLTPQWIEPMIELFDNQKVGLVGNLQIKEGGVWDGTIDSAGSEWVWHSGVFSHIGRHSHKHNELPHPFKPESAPKDILQVNDREMVTGCCIAMPTELFRYIGGFNPNYRIGYWEDSEICMTVRELGYRILFTPKSKIYHKLSHSESGAHAFQNHNRHYFYNKWVNSGRIDSMVSDQRKEKPNVRTIVLKRSGAHGDVLMAAAVAPALKEKHNCKILFLTDCPDVLKNNPYIDRVINHQELSERQFQVYYDLDMAYEYRPKANILDAYAQLVGVKRQDCKMYLSSVPVEGLPDNFVAIHAGRTNWIGRNWSSDQFAVLSNEIQRMGYQIVVVGTKGDYLVPCQLDLRGQTSFPQLASVLAQAKLFVGIDSFPMHAAQAVGTPGVCFFGSVLPETRIIQPNMHGVNAASLSCIGCHHRKPTPCVVTNNCEVGGEPCIYGVSAEMMLNKIKGLLSHR